MAKPVLLTADSVCDLTPQLAEQYNIKVLPLTVIEGDDSYKDGVDIHPEMIYEIYEESRQLPKTAAISPQEFIDFFSSYVEQGYEIVHLDISAKLSSTYQNACLAASTMEGVYVVDSCNLTTSMGLMLFKAAALRDEGKSAGEIADFWESFKHKLSTTFVVDTLEFIWKGGRCSGVTALGANLLRIKPCLGMVDGELKMLRKYRGSMKKVYLQYLEDVLSQDNIDTSMAVLVNSGGIDDQTMEELRTFVLEKLPFETLYMTKAGCSVCSHCGPGTVGLEVILN